MIHDSHDRCDETGRTTLSSSMIACDHVAMGCSAKPQIRSMCSGPVKLTWVTGVDVPLDWTGAIAN